MRFLAVLLSLLLSTQALADPVETKTSTRTMASQKELSFLLVRCMGNQNKCLNSVDTLEKKVVTLETDKESLTKRNEQLSEDIKKTEADARQRVAEAEEAQGWTTLEVVLISSAVAAAVGTALFVAGFTMGKAGDGQLE